MSERESLFSLRWKTNRIVMHWLVVCVLAIPAAFIGWTYGVGIIVGMFVKPLYDWKNRGE